MKSQLIKKYLYNPILLKEYSWRIRSKKTPLILFGYLFLLGVFIFSALGMFQEDINEFDTETSIGLFLFLTGLQMVLGAFILPAITSGLISSEREKQTLSVLLTTSLDSSQIIVGKWFAALGFIFMLFISSLPIYVVVYGYGGISLKHLFWVVLHLFVSMMFYSSLGIFFSAWVKRTGFATVLAYVVVLGHGFGILVIVYFNVLINSSTKKIPLMIDFLLALHPIVSMLSVFNVMDDIDSIIGTNLYLIIYLIFYFLASIGLLIASTYVLSPARFQRRRGRKA